MAARSWRFESSYPHQSNSSQIQAPISQGGPSMRRLLVASFIFLISLSLLMLPSLLAIYHGISRGATGFAYVVGSVRENLYRIGAVLVSAAFAYWLSGKLIGL